MKYGYIMEYVSAVEQSDNIALLREAMGPKYVLYEEALEDEEIRPKWREMLGKLKKNDELYILKFSNAVRNLRELTMLLEICTVEKIHLVSLNDKLDSSDDKVARVFSVFGSLTIDIAAQRNRENTDRPSLKKRTNLNFVDKQERNGTVEKLYLEGVPVPEIMQKTRIHSNSTIYRILQELGLDPKRRPEISKAALDEKSASR